MAHTFKGKRSSFGVEMRTFHGKKGTYLVMRIKRSYHVFAEIEAKEAARDCDQTLKKGNVRSMWDKIWNEQ